MSLPQSQQSAWSRPPVLRWFPVTPRTRTTCPGTATSPATMTCCPCAPAPPTARAPRCPAAPPALCSKHPTTPSPSPSTQTGMPVDPSAPSQHRRDVSVNDGCSADGGRVLLFIYLCYLCETPRHKYQVRTGVPFSRLADVLSISSEDGQPRTTGWRVGDLKVMKLPRVNSSGQGHFWHLTKTWDLETADMTSRKGSSWVGFGHLQRNAVQLQRPQIYHTVLVFLQLLFSCLHIKRIASGSVFSLWNVIFSMCCRWSTVH